MFEILSLPGALLAGAFCIARLILSRVISLSSHAGGYSFPVKSSRSACTGGGKNACKRVSAFPCESVISVLVIGDVRLGNVVCFGVRSLAHRIFFHIFARDSHILLTNCLKAFLYSRLIRLFLKFLALRNSSHVSSVLYRFQCLFSCLHRCWASLQSSVNPSLAYGDWWVHGIEPSIPTCTNRTISAVKASTSLSNYSHSPDWKAFYVNKSWLISFQAISCSRFTSIFLQFLTLTGSSGAILI